MGNDEDLIRRLRDAGNNEAADALEDAARKLSQTEKELEDCRSRESLKSYIKAKARRMKWLLRRG